MMLDNNDLFKVPMKFIGGYVQNSELTYSGVDELNEMYFKVSSRGFGVDFFMDYEPSLIIFDNYSRLWKPVNHAVAGYVRHKNITEDGFPIWDVYVSGEDIKPVLCNALEEAISCFSNGDIIFLENDDDWVDNFLEEYKKKFEKM